MPSRTYFLVSALIFGLVAVMHLLRSLNQWALQIGPFILPPWLSWVGMLVSAALSVLGFRLARR